MKDPDWLVQARAEGRITEKGVKMPALEAAPSQETKKRPNKYGNRKVVVQGHKFDSQKEANRYVELGALQKTGKIKDLKLQVRFPLKVSGLLVCTYVADFTYDEFLFKAAEEEWISVVEDVKSDFTRKNPVYRIKNKLMAAVLGIVIREV